MGSFAIASSLGILSSPLDTKATHYQSLRLAVRTDYPICDKCVGLT